MTALIHLLTLLLTAIASAIAADAYVNILTQPGQVLAFWARFLFRLQDAYVGTTLQEFNEGDEGPDRAEYYAVRHDRAEFVLKPLLTCVYCVAGQMGFWLSTYIYWHYWDQFTPILSIITAFCAVWLGGAIQSVRQKNFPL